MTVTPGCNCQHYQRHVSESEPIVIAADALTRIEPGATYAVVVHGQMSANMAQRVRESFNEYTGANLVLLAIDSPSPRPPIETEPVRR